MMFAQIDDLTDEPVRVNLLGRNRIRLAWGASASISLDVAEAVDLVDAIATTLAELCPAAALPERTPENARDLARDEQRVRAEAEVRESL